MARGERVNNNRTIGELKNLQGGGGKAIDFRWFSTASSGNWGWVFAHPGTASPGVNGLNHSYIPMKKKTTCLF